MFAYLRAEGVEIPAYYQHTGVRDSIAGTARDCCGSVRGRCDGWSKRTRSKGRRCSVGCGSSAAPCSTGWSWSTRRSPSSQYTFSALRDLAREGFGQRGQFVRVIVLHHGEVRGAR